MIRYADTTDDIGIDQLEGFFVGWPSAPSLETHLAILKGSHAVVLAVDDSTDRVVGFVSAASDGVLAAYIPLLEVLPEYRGQGIGRALMERILKKLDRFYMVDLACDPEMESFYSSLGMRPAHAMVIRNRDRQSGE